MFYFIHPKTKDWYAKCEQSTFLVQETFTEGGNWIFAAESLYKNERVNV